MNFESLFTNDELQLLRQRADRVAVSIREDDKTGTMSVLTISLQSEKFGLPIDAIMAVHDEVLIVPVPGVPGFVAGIANVRGHIISVLNLPSLLGLKSAVGEIGSMLVVDTAGGNIGFYVEAIGEVIELPASSLKPMPTNTNIERPEYFQGIFPDGMAVLNITKIVDDQRLIVDDSLA